MKTPRATLHNKGAQTRHAILQAAIARFGREGYRATSVADIARDARVGGTVAYAYFADKEALFLAALDEDAAALIQEALTEAFAEPDVPDWRETLFFTLFNAVERHPLAERLLAGLEPDVTDRVLEIPALTELRKACAERLGAEQLSRRHPARHRSGGHQQRHRRHHVVAVDVGGAARHRRHRAVQPRCRRGVRGRAPSSGGTLTNSFSTQ